MTEYSDGTPKKAERQIKVLLLDSTDRSAMVCCKLRDCASRLKYRFAASGVKFSIRDPTAALKTASVINSDVCKSMVTYVMKGLEVPVVQYVLVGHHIPRPINNIFSPLFKQQTIKYGGGIYYLDVEQTDGALDRQIEKILNDFTNNNERNLLNMKETKKIYNDLMKNEDKNLSLRENMVRYLTEVEKYPPERASEVVDQIIKGTSDLSNQLERVNGMTKEEMSAELSDRIKERLKDIPADEADKILENLYLEMKAFGCDKMAEVASNIADDGLKATVEQIRAECATSLEGKSYEEKIRLIVEAAENCGSLTALTTLAEDEHSFTSAQSIDDAVATAMSDEKEEQQILDEYAFLRTKNYAALGEYVSAQHGTNRRFNAETSPYTIGVTAAAGAESKRIRAAAWAGKITFENALKLLGKIAAIGFALCAGLFIAVPASVGAYLGFFAAGLPILAGIMLVAGTVLTYNGIKIVIRNRDKIGGAIATPFVWIKDLFVKLIKAFARIFSSKKKSDQKESNGENVEESVVEEIVAEEVAAEETKSEEKENQVKNENYTPAQPSNAVLA